MAFPDSDLPLQFEAAFGADPEASPGTWTFTSLTSRHLDSVVNLRVGKRAGSKTADPSAVGALFNNHDGELTPLRALSSYWPNIKLDTPFRCTMRRADDTFTRSVSNGWGTSDSGHAWTTVGGVAADYSTSGTQGSVSVSATGSDRVTVVDLDGRHQDVRVTATTNATPSGGTIDTGVVARYTDSSNYYVGAATVSTGGVVTATIAKRVAGSLSTVTSVSTGLSTATSKKIRFRVTENRLQLKIWLTSAIEPDAWNLDVLDDSLTTGEFAGSYSRRNTGNVSPTTFTYDSFDTTHVLLEGFTDSWKPEFVPNTDGGTSVVRVAASGPLRRLGQGSKSLRSPMYRSISGVATNDYQPLAYWPLEDGSDSTQFASGVPGGSAMTLAGDIGLAVDSDLPGSEPLPTFAASAIATGLVPTYTSTGQWVFQVAAKLDAEPVFDVMIARIYVTGSAVARWDVFVGFSGGAGDVAVGGYDAAGNLVSGVASAVDADFYGRWQTISLAVYPIGGDLAATLYYFDGLGTSTGPFGDTTAGAVSGAVTSVVLGGTEGFAVGHAALFVDPAFDPDIDVGATSAAMYGHPGEQAQDRLARLCREERVPFAGLPGYSTTPMGPQLVDTFMANLLDCETTDQGVLGEGNFGLTYIPRAARYRRPVGPTIDLSSYRTTAGTSAQVLSPIFDDAQFRNEWTVSRPNGATVIGADFSRVQLSYEDSAIPNLLSDGELIDHMAWRLAVSSVESMRWPNTPVDLAANPAMIGEWLGATCGLTRIVRTGLPERGPDGDIDELLDGIEHTIRRRAWTLNYAASPVKVYNEVGVYGTDPVGSRYGVANTVLAEDLTSSETAADVTATGETWATTATHPSVFPFDVDIGGLTYSCTAITGTTPNYTLTLTRLAADKAHSTGDAVTITDAGRYGL